MDNNRHNSMLVPYVRRRHLAALQPTSRFTVPRGWGVEEVPRRDGSRSDLYYYEPGTGKKFRSIREVNRYLRGGELLPYQSARRLSLRIRSPGNEKKLVSAHKKLSPPKHQLSMLNPRCRRMVVSDGKFVKLDDELSPSKEAARSAPYFLPEGWIVEEVPRKHSSWADRYYYDPESGQKFRSLAAVERYLAELHNDNIPLAKALEEIKENKPLSKIFKIENRTKNSTPRNKNIFEEKTEAPSFVAPPSKVNWVFANPQEDVWNPFISDKLVPNAVKQQWKDRFMLLMND